MLVRDAIERLDGHSIMAVETAKEVCQALELPFDDRLIMQWQNAREALETFGFVAVHEGKGAGVDGLDLSYHVAEKLGLGRPGGAFTGKGFQARANQQAIRRFLSELGKL